MGGARFGGRCWVKGNGSHGRVSNDPIPAGTDTHAVLRDFSRAAYQQTIRTTASLYT